jgi:hypothetical protein
VRKFTKFSTHTRTFEPPYRGGTLPGRGLLCNFTTFVQVYNFSPRIDLLRFTVPTTHRWKQEKIPQAASEPVFEIDLELFTVDSSRRPSRAQAPRARGACNFSK